MKLTCLFGAALLASTLAVAQTPAPVIVPAASTDPAAGAASVTTQSATRPDSDTIAFALKALAAMKAANEEMLQKQAATLQQLDELEKSAEQLRIYSKRG